MHTVGRSLRRRAQRVNAKEATPPHPRVALVVGAGGTARSACYAAKQLGCRVLVHNRTPAKAAALATRFGGTTVASLDEPIPALAAILCTVPAEVRAAGCGGFPPAGLLTLFLRAEQAGFKVPSHLLASHPVVLDAAYGRTETALVAQARAAGCACVEGIDMLLAQGLAQFRLWTGRRPPALCMEAAVRGTEVGTAAGGDR